MKLSDITEVERFTYKPGDRFVLHTALYPISSGQAHEIVSCFRAALQLPDDVPVALVSDDWQVTIVSPDEQEHPERDARSNEL